MTEKPNDKKINILPLFPTPAVIANIGRDFTEDELQFLLHDIIMYKPSGDGTLNLNHRSKDFYLFDNYSELLKDIKIFCENWVKYYLEEIEGVDTDLASLRITQSWINKTKPGESHHGHYHPNSYLSGVLYITCLPNDSINFENRSYEMFNNIKFPTPKITMWNANGISQNVTEGDLVLFPSWIPHSVNRNETKNRERISFAFNTFPIGEMGDYDSLTPLKL